MPMQTRGKCPWGNPTGYRGLQQLLADKPLRSGSDQFMQDGLAKTKYRQTHHVHLLLWAKRHLFKWCPLTPGRGEAAVPLRPSKPFGDREPLHDGFDHMNRVVNYV